MSQTPFARITPLPLQSDEHVRVGRSGVSVSGRYSNVVQVDCNIRFPYNISYYIQLWRGTRIESCWILSEKQPNQIDSFSNESYLGEHSMKSFPVVQKSNKKNSQIANLREFTFKCSGFDPLICGKLHKSFLYLGNLATKTFWIWKTRIFSHTQMFHSPHFSKQYCWNESDHRRYSKQLRVVVTSYKIAE